MSIEFAKFQGTGNDFVMIDNREGIFNRDCKKLINKMCDRRFGIGADGLILLENAEGYDFRMVYFNSDGIEAEMCGNGGRCVVAFAKSLGIISHDAKFITADGPHVATIDNNDIVSLRMSDVNTVKVYDDGLFLNTGVPHFVKFVSDLSSVDIDKEGRTLRHDNRFQPAGTNADFVKREGSKLTVYTFERGVEAETLACGTGATAAAIGAAYSQPMKNSGERYSFDITVKGGELAVSFFCKNGSFSEIDLKGPALKVFDGVLQ